MHIQSGFKEDSLDEFKQIKRDRIWFFFFIWTAVISTLVPFIDIYFRWNTGGFTALNFLTGTLCIHVGYRGITLGKAALKMSYTEYVQRRMLPATRDLYRRRGVTIYAVPKIRYFLFSDLAKLEEGMLSLLRLDEEKFLREQMLKKHGPRNELLLSELVMFLKQSGIDEGQIGQVRELWEDLPIDSSRRRKFADNLMNKIRHDALYGAYQTKPGDSNIPTPRTMDTDDARLKALQLSAAQTKSPRAQELYERGAQAPDRRTKLRLYKEALHAETETEKPNLKAPSAKREQTNRGSAVMQFITLHNVVQERFRVESLVPPEVDAQMVKQILLALIDPGNREKRIGEVYRTKSRLKVMVSSQYDSWLDSSMDSAGFDRTLGWMERQRILCTKPKSETVYSINPNEREGTTLAARGIIAYTKKFLYDFGVERN